MDLICQGVSDRLLAESYICVEVRISCNIFSLIGRVLAHFYLDKKSAAEQKLSDPMGPPHFFYSLTSTISRVGQMTEMSLNYLILA